MAIKSLAEPIYGIISTAKYVFGPRDASNIRGRDDKDWSFAMSDIVPQNTLRDDTPNKRCSKCTRWLPFSAFGPLKTCRDGLNSWCKECKRELRRKSTTPQEMRKETLRKFGMTPQQYDRILEEQGGVCAVCKQPETRCSSRSKTGQIDRLAVDHDHATGDARALLCHRCNVSLGMMDEDPEYIRALAEYAEWCKTREQSVQIIQLRLME